MDDESRRRGGRSGNIFEGAPPIGIGVPKLEYVLVRKNVDDELEDVTGGLYLVSAISEELFANTKVSPTFALSMHNITRSD